MDNWKIVNSNFNIIIINNFIDIILITPLRCPHPIAAVLTLRLFLQRENFKNIATWHHGAPKHYLGLLGL